MKTDWEQLSKEQKVKYKSYCDKKFGKTIMFDEAGEPMYLDENFDMIDTSIIIKLLFTPTTIKKLKKCQTKNRVTD